MSNPESTPSANAQIPSMTATTPVFIHDQNKDRNQDVFWEVGADHEGSIPTSEENNEENGTFVDDQPPEVEDQPEDIKDEEETPPQEDSETDQDEEEEERKRKRANKNPAQKRISELTRRAKEAEARAYQAEMEKSAMEQRLIIKEKEAFDSNEKHLTANKEHVQKILKEAIEDGDSDKIAKATDLLTQYNARLLMMNDEKTRQRNNVQPQSQQQNTRTPPDYPLNDEMMQTGLEWLNDNSWADQNSEDFDEEMHIEADEYSKALARKYKFQGKFEKVGSAEFYNEISDYIFDKFNLTTPEPKNIKPATKERMTMKSNNSAPVASVNRSANTSPPAKTYKEIQLSPEQKEMAHAMAGTIRDNNRNIITDKKTLEEIYKRNMFAQKGQ